MKETDQFKEQFEVYVQALVSQSLDDNFLEEVYNDNGDFFLQINLKYYFFIKNNDNIS
jgi:hypothetical protein